MTNTTGNAQRTPTLTGRWVEYHGSLTAWYGHHFKITHRARTEFGFRYILSDSNGSPVLRNVSPGSVTPLHTAITSTWGERFDQIRAKAAEAVPGYLAEVEQHLTQARRHVEDGDYVTAQRRTLDLEDALQLISPDAYQQRCAELDEAHGPERPPANSDATGSS